MKTIWLAGGCFWGTQKYLDQFGGVRRTVVGYANGHTAEPSYEDVCGGSGHAETVEVTYDETVLPLERLLYLYFLAIEPTSVDRQGGDSGVQYRTGIYYEDPSDLPVIRRVMEREQAAYNEPLAVEVLPLEAFWPAEEYHQKYLDARPGGYCHVAPALLGIAGPQAAGDEKGQAGGIRNGTGRLCILVPGRGYTCAEPLMQRIALFYEALGYARLTLDLSMIDFRSMTELDDMIAAALPQLRAELSEAGVLPQPGRADAGAGAQDPVREIVVVSKSLGTTCAVMLDEELRRAHPDCSVRHVPLTPLPQTLAVLDEEPEQRPGTAGRLPLRERVIVTAIGTRDRFIGYSEVTRRMEAWGIPCLLVEGAGHALKLETPGENDRVNDAVLRLLAL